MMRTLSKTRRQRKTGSQRLMPEIIIMTDEHRMPDPVAVAKSIPQNWGMVYRNYESADRELIAQDLARVCHERGVTFLVAGDWRLADRVHANGVHLPEGLVGQNLMAPNILWQRKGNLLSMSAHGPDGLRNASLFGADLVMLSPVEATESHIETATLGCFRFAALVRSTQIPVYALGGMTIKHQRRLTAVGASGLAGIGIGVAAAT